MSWLMSGSFARPAKSCPIDSNAEAEKSANPLPASIAPLITSRKNCISGARLRATQSATPEISSPNASARAPLMPSIATSMLRLADSIFVEVLSLIVASARSAAPAAPSIPPSCWAAVDRSSDARAPAMSSACVPNSATASCARAAGSSTPRSPLRICCSPSRAAGPPSANLRAMSSCPRPIFLSASPAFLSPRSFTRIVSSLRESATLSALNAPPSRPCTSRPTASCADKPRSRKWVGYSTRVSSRSCEASAPF